MLSGVCPILTLFYTLFLGMLTAFGGVASLLVEMGDPLRLAGVKVYILFNKKARAKRASPF